MANPQRIVIKLGTSVLTNGTKRLSRRRMLEIARQAAQLHDDGHQVVVVSSGAIAAGREALNYPDLDRSVPARQMLSAVGQGRLIQIYTELFALFDITVGQVLLTRGDIARRRTRGKLTRQGYLNARDTFLNLLTHRIIPIVNENDTVATEEIKVGDNDNLSARFPNLIDADLLILLTDQQGLYDADPRSNPDAKLIPIVPQIDELIFLLAGGTSTGLGTGGMITKLQAAELAGRSGTATVIASGALPNVLIDIVAGRQIGTAFPPPVTHRESRKRWLLAEKPQGTISVDAGAVNMLCNKGASLLPVGIKDVNGDFERGALVRILAPDGQPIAAGISNYASHEIDALKGVQSSQIERILNHTYGEEVIHRDNLVLF